MHRDALWVVALAVCVRLVFGYQDCACDTPSNRAALMQVFSQTGGAAAWAAGAQYSANDAVCQWYGIICSDTRVKQFAVPSEIGMEGGLPTSIALLVDLELLSINNQSALRGSIPSEWRALQKLRTLRVTHCPLAGGIPEWIGSDLQSLEFLIFDSTNLTGVLTASLAQLDKLRHLRLPFNRFTGTVPEAWKNLTSLETLALGGNDLHGSIPGWLGPTWKGLSLNLGGNKFSGTMPVPSHTLQTLDAPGNRLTGTLAEVLFAAPRTHVHLQDNLLNGALPPAASNGTTLTVVELDRNAFEGALPVSWGTMPLLQLSLTDQRGDGFCGGIPATWDNNAVLVGGASMLGPKLNRTCTNETMSASASVSLCPCDTDGVRSALLSVFYATGGPTNWTPSARFDEALPVCSWPHIQCGGDAGVDGSDFWLGVEFNSHLGMQGTLPDGIGGLGKHLRALRIYELGLGGPIPPSWATLVGLVTFSLGGPGINGSFPLWIGDSWRALEQFTLFSTNVHGTLPSNLGNLKGLAYLHISSSNISGTLPDEVGSLTSLTYIGLQWNPLLGGTIPEAVGNLVNLAAVNINFCSFEGPLPASLQRLTNLSRLVARSNKLSGTMPSWLPKLQSLRYLHLHSNRMIGMLPPSSGLPPMVGHMLLSNNSFYGPLPPSWPSHPTLWHVALEQFNSTETHRHLCGGVPLSWSANRSTFSYIVNGGLVNQSCPSFTASASLSSCEMPMSLVVDATPSSDRCHLGTATSGGCLPLPLQGALPRVASADGIGGSTSTAVFYLTFELPYDMMAFHASSAFTFALNTTWTSSAGGPVWPLENASGCTIIHHSLNPDKQVSVVLSPVAEQWPMTFAPYRSQIVPLALLNSRCAAARASIVVSVAVQPRAASQLTEAIGTSSSVATWGSALAPSGSTASATARIAAVQKLLLCSEDAAGGDSGGGLIGWSLPSNDRLGAARGAIAGNALLLVGLTVTALSASKGLAVFAHTPWWAFVQRMHLPSLMFPLFAATLPSSVGAAVAIAKHGDGSTGALAWVLVVVCVICWGMPLLWLAWAAMALPRLIRATHGTTGSQEAPPKSRRAQGLLDRVMRRHTYWHPVATSENSNADAAAATAALAGYHVMLREYNWLWFPCIESTVTALGGAIAAATVGVDAAACQGGSIALCVLFVVQLVRTAWMRPFTTIAGLVHCLVLNALSVMCVAFQVASSAYGGSGTNTKEVMWAINGSTACALAVLGIATMRTAIDCVALLQGVRGLWRYMCSARADASLSNDLLQHNGDDGVELGLVTFEMQQVQQDDDSVLHLSLADESSERSSPRSISVLRSFRSSGDAAAAASSFRLSDAEAQFWDAHGNARVREADSDADERTRGHF